jgi:hypothetical protein
MFPFFIRISGGLTCKEISIRVFNHNICALQPLMDELTLYPIAAIKGNAIVSTTTFQYFQLR